MLISSLSIVCILCSAHCVNAFDVPNKRHRLHRWMASTKLSMKPNDRIDVVIFGIGDLRTDDHGGLKAAIDANESNKWLMAQPTPTILKCTVNLHFTPISLESKLDLRKSISPMIKFKLIMVQTLQSAHCFQII